MNLITALGFCNMTSSIETMEHLECAHGLVTSLRAEVFPGALQTDQKIGGCREALQNEMNLKDSEVSKTYWLKTFGGFELCTMLQ